MRYQIATLAVALTLSAEDPQESCEAGARMGAGILEGVADVERLREGIARTDTGGLRARRSASARNNSCANYRKKGIRARAIFTKGSTSWHRYLLRRLHGLAVAQRPPAGTLFEASLNDETAGPFRDRPRAVVVLRAIEFVRLFGPRP